MTAREQLFLDLSNVRVVVVRVRNPTVEATSALKQNLPSGHLDMWSQVLSEINEAHLYLRTAGYNVHQSELRIGSLTLWRERHRDSIIDEAITYSRNICQGLGIEPRASRTRSENLEMISIGESLRVAMR